MAQARKTGLWLLVGGALAVAAGVFWFSRQFQVYNVLAVSGAAGMMYSRSPSTWFSTKEAALAHAVKQRGGGLALAVVADRNGGILEGRTPDGFLTGEELDALLVAYEQRGLKLEATA